MCNEALVLMYISNIPQFMPICLTLITQFPFVLCLSQTVKAENWNSSYFMPQPNSL